MLPKGTPMERKDDAQAVPLTPPSKIDSQWREKLAKAREARRMSEVARRGKPASFRNGVGRKIP